MLVMWTTVGAKRKNPKQPTVEQSQQIEDNTFMNFELSS